MTDNSKLLSLLIGAGITLVHSEGFALEQGLTDSTSGELMKVSTIDDMFDNPSHNGGCNNGGCGNGSC